MAERIAGWVVLLALPAAFLANLIRLAVDSVRQYRADQHQYHSSDYPDK